MKTILISFLIIASAINPLLAQVGINTEDPQASLDINGNVKIRTVTDDASTTVLVLGTNNEVMKNTTLMARSFVAGSGGSSIGLISTELASGWHKIQFASKELDDYNAYNNTSSPIVNPNPTTGTPNILAYEYAAPQTGIYRIYAQFETTGLVTVGEVGLAIFKKLSGGSTYTEISEESYLNVGIDVLLVTVAVSPPTRKTQRLVKLNAGDVITFAAKVPALSVTLVGGSKSFFTIEQIR